MTVTQLYLLKVNIPILLLTVLFSLTIGFSLITIVSFVISWVLIYLISYNCFHRYWAHRQFELDIRYQKIFAYLGLFCMTGDAVSYALTHRYHHKHSDSDKDIHSPIHGFWHSFVGWMLKPTPSIPLSTVKDLLGPRYTYLQPLLRHQIKIIWISLIVLYLINSSIAFGLMLAMCGAFILEMLSNSILNHSTKTRSAVNNKFYAWASLSSYHKMHHDFPSIVHDTDPGHVLLKFLALLGALKTKE